MMESERGGASRRGSSAANPPGIFLYSAGDLPELEDGGRLAIVAAQGELLNVGTAGAGEIVLKR